ncbi:hypothetical protein Ocin01_00430 [Orchesella cincta]|uniref:Uncharacterized protein n=1 Tax=Orchesella cincta TaxID=48709 RepID=A0A1D2NLX2_ORCCI|nr:hypothetical protein Ocin01_00430 [Orchesella cincta]
MSRLDETAGVEPKTPENDKTAKGKESGNSEKEKTAEKSNRNEDSVSSKKDKNESGKKDEGKEDSKRKRKEDERVHRDKKSEKRKRSKERRSSEKSRDSDEGGEVGVTSTGLPIKIPASAMPEKKQSDSRDHRSRSPRHKRDRSRSPRHKRSKSPRKKSRSPRRRRKSRSPITRVERVPREPTHVRENRERRRSTSAERVERFLARTNRRSRSPSNGHVRKRHRRSRSKSPTPSSITKRDNREFHEKLALMTEGKWSDDMENRWKLMEVDEAMFKESFGDRQKLLIEVPEKHENYGEEWTHFWEQRFQEVEEQGLDAEKYDYVPEWKDFWNKRLKELLAKEFETKIKEIKKKYGMDFDTLKRLRCKPEVVPVPPAPVLTPHLVVAPSLAMIPPLPHVGLPPLPVPAPHNTMVPQMVPPPQAAAPLPVPSPKASILAFASGSVSSRSTTSDDHTSRPMSISDGGDDNNHSGIKTSTNAPTKPAVPVTAGDIMSTWEKLRTGGGSSNLSATSGDRVTAQQTSLPKAVNNNIDAKSNADSGSIASYEFDGYDIPQVLRLMCSVEDHLSYYAIKVQEYFTRAEEMELKKRNAAKKLLDEEEFVALLFTLRERFMKMIRANVLHRDVLRSLNHIVYALDSMMESPQCQMYKNKLASAAESNSANSNVEPEVKNNESVIDKSAEDARVSSVRTEKVTPAATHRTMEEEIARLLTVFLLTNGHADISDSNLRYFVKKMVPPLTPTEPTSQPTRASPGNPASGPSDTRTFNVPPSSNQQRPAGRPEPGQLDGQWDAVDGSMFSRTYNIANSRAGSGFPSLPTAYRPSSEEDEPPRHGRGMSMPGMGRGRGSGSNNMPSSENSGAQSPFRGRGYGGINSSYPPYYDQHVLPEILGKGGLNTQSVSSCSQNNISTLDAASSVVTSMLGNTQFRQTQTPLELQKRPQVSVDQLTSSVVNEEHPSNEIVIDSDDSITIFDNHQSKTVKESPPPAPQPRLPPGILNMIMKEKKRQQAPEAGEILSEEESQFDRRVEREPQKKKKKKRKKERHHESRDSSSDSEADSRRRYHRKRKRRKRKRKDERYETRRRTPSPSPARSEISSGSSIQLLRKAPPRHDDSDIEVLEELPLPTTPPSLIQGRALLRESNLQDKDNCTYNWNMADVTSPIASPPLSIVGSSSAKSVCRGDENNQFAPTCPGKKPKKRSANWDTVSEASSRARRKKHSNSTVVQKDNNKEEENFVRKSKERKASRIATSNKKDDEEAVCSSKKVSKVTSVSETFWTTNDDAKSLCSISTNESLDVKESDKTPIVCGAQPVRKYRASCEIEKEPGEISDSISSVSSVLND